MPCTPPLLCTFNEWWTSWLGHHLYA